VNELLGTLLAIGVPLVAGLWIEAWAERHRDLNTAWAKAHPQLFPRKW